MPRMVLLIVMVLFTLMGCASGGATAKVDTISFDRGAFALTYADVSHMLRASCAAKKPAVTTEECTRMDELDKAIRKQILTPPSAPVTGSAGGLDMEQIQRLIQMGVSVMSKGAL